MERYDRDNYYHSGLGSENRRDWDRSSRDGDFGRDYENRFRNTHDRDEEYRRRNYGTDRNYTSRHGQSHDPNEIRRGYGISDVGGENRFTDTGENIEQRMRRDRNYLYDRGYGSGRTSGYSGAAFGGSNYSSDGGFGGSEEYGAMSGGGGNVDDYVSMSGYGGGRGNVPVRSDRGVPNYSSGSSRSGQYNSDYRSSGFGSNYGDRHYGTSERSSSWNRDNYNDNSGNEDDNGMNYRSFGIGNTSVYDRRNADRGGYSNYDPNY
ncbi:hypothetical protein [Pontibacter fetidus]|uniref:Uncharacterized protein n=1 Tax=Pontibacter fetidus TaxID=2700082 RepID=A0A6B2GZA7_9BACT|nr:hypothetical protein [Pontibacter fetidus]NDK55361.1 hypothetical protein [Pontibacter fetidus]